MLKKWFMRQKSHWLDKRIPIAQAYTFDVNNTFIMPSIFGWSVIGISVCLFVLGTNYQNNIILLVCYFLIALLLLSLFQSYFYFTRFSIKFNNADEYYANRDVTLRADIQFAHKESFGQLMYRYSKSIDNVINIEHDTLFQHLKLGKFARGQHNLDRLTFSSTYPFGLFRCWTHLAIPFSLNVYPEPIKAALVVNNTEQNDKADAQRLVSSSSEELQGIREYSTTDPIHHVSWKHVAKGQGLLSKDFAEHVSAKTILRLKPNSSLNLELELSKLTYLVNQLSRHSQTFGLELGRQQILPNTGEGHRLQCLKELATFSINDFFTEHQR